MSDQSLIGLFLTKREVYERYESTVPRHLLEPETQVIVEDIGQWYESHPGHDPIVPKNIERYWENIKLVRHAGMSADKLDLMKRLLQRSVKAAGTHSAAEILKSLVLRDHAGRIAEKCDRYSAGDTTFPLFDDLLDDVEEATIEAGTHDPHSHEVTDCIHEVMDSLTNLSSGVHWRSPNLEQSLGTLRKGDFVMIAGFVDSGKSTMLASEVTYIATQLKGDEKVLYFNNEEGGKKVRGRLYQAALGMTLQQLNSNRDACLKKYIDMMGGDPRRIVLIDNEKTPITPGLIRKKLRQYNAKLMVFDQMYKIKGFKRYGEDKLGQLQDIFEYGRTLAKGHCPVIAVHQARGDANGCQRIEMHQLAGSQQALQGELDAIVTIGRDMEHPQMRYIYVPKNKMPTPTSDPEIRNGFFPVQPDFARGRFDE